MISIKDVLFMDTLKKEKVAQQKYIDEFGCAVVSTIIGSSAGQYIYAHFMDMMGEDPSGEDSEYHYDRALEMMEQATDELGEFMEDDNYRVDNHEDGSICVFYGTCKEDL